MANERDIIRIDPRANFFAQHAGYYGYHQYDAVGPTDQLKMVTKMCLGQCTEQQKKLYMSLLPKVMVAGDWDKEGNAILREVETDKVSFVGPGSGEGKSTVTGTGLVSILAGDAVQEGAMAEVCAREVVKIKPMKSEVETTPFFTKAVYLKPVATGTNAVNIAQDLGKATLKTESYRAYAAIAEELDQDTEIDFKADMANELGHDHELTLNQKVFSVLANNYGLSVTLNTDATDNISLLLIARAKAAAAGFRPTDAVLWPLYEAGVFTKNVPAYNEIAQGQLEQRKIGYGKLDYHFTGVAGGVVRGGAASAPSFNWASTGDIGALVIDKSRAGTLGLRLEMELKDYSDALKYMSGPIVNMRYDFVCSVDDSNPTTRNNKNAIVACLHN